MPPPIADDVRRFILASVPSVPFLEAMLLLRAGHPAAWDAGAIARRLYIPPQRAEELMRQLVEAGVAAPDAEGRCCRWDPAPHVAAVVDELAKVYSENLLEVTGLIHARQDRRAQQFADAFRWRKKED